jgi:predicted ATPase
VLQNELDAEPSPATRQLYEAIQSGQLGAAAPVPLPTTSARRHNLPAQLTSFIGREQEIAEVSRLVSNHRLVTLTGSGGTGKTRLALQTAAGLLEHYADGIWLVELAPLSDPTLVPTIAARALGLRDQSGPQAFSLLQEYLERKQLLLILDNCEHVIEACVRLANALLQACPKLSILASSREALGIAGEVSFRVPPLTFPEVGKLPPLEILAQSEAIRLFVERAAVQITATAGQITAAAVQITDTAVQTTAAAVQITDTAVQTTAASPGFALTQANASAILQVCQRLDGIPLAIELAAARVRLLQVAEIAQHLDDRFSLLTGGSRAALPRQQTLRASIDWSYGLLSPYECTLLQRLSVFAGGWVLEAAEAVGCGEGIEACNVLELLGNLVDKSLIQTVSEAAGVNRFRMLETIRQYAHEKLFESGQARAARDRHLQYYLGLTEKVGEKIRGPDIARILEMLETELDNLRLALAWSLERRGRPGWDPEPGLRLAAALKWFWHCRGRQDEGIHWLEMLLAGEMEERGLRPLTPERTRCRAKALGVAAWSAVLIDEKTKAGKWFTESLDLYRSLGADGRVSYAHAVVFRVDNDKLAPTEAIRLNEECQAIFQEAGDRFGLANCFHVRGHIARYQNEYERAKAFYEAELALRKEIGDLDGAAGSYIFLSFVNYSQGKIEQARALCEESLRLFSENHNDSYVGFQNINLGRFDRMEGNYAQAIARASEGLSIGRRQGDVSLIRDGLLDLGELALLQGYTLEAAERFEESLAYFRKKDHKLFIADSFYYLGLLAWAEGRYEQAWRMYMDALINCRAGADIYREAGILCEQGKVALARGEIDQAQTHFEQVFKVAIPHRLLEWEDRNPIMLTLEATATLAAAQGKLEGASHLLGATEAWHIRVHNTRTPRERQEREAHIAALRANLGEQAFAAAWTEGQAMTKEQTVDRALAFCLARQAA